jgi:heat-inducible transcriptional repressor
MMDDLLHDTSLFLARLTHHAAVVVGPQPDVTRLRMLHLVPLEPRTLIVVAVLSDGGVEKETLRFDEDLDEADIAEAGRRLMQHLEGSEFDELSTPPMPGAATDAAHDIARAAVDALRNRAQTIGEPLFVGGASRLAAEGQSFGSPEAVSHLLELLEQQAVVVALMRELLGPGVTVTIGTENSRTDLQECSLVVAPYFAEGAPAGTIGVLGPTRMDYRQAQAAVSTISARLSRRLSR